MDYDIRVIQDFQLQMLKQVRDVCEESNIRFFLSSGTLLGAVRHQGFIPWDDDVDIEMPYSDYCKFLKIAPQKLGEDYFIQTHETDEWFPRLYAKVRKNNTTMILKNEVQLKGHHGIWIDIFPQTHITGKFDFKAKQLLVSMSNWLFMNQGYFDQAISTKGNTNKGALFVRRITRAIPFSFRREIALFLEKLVFMKWSKEPKYTGCVWGNITDTYPTSVFRSTCLLQFEDDVFPAPIEYETYLKTTYGDYMTPPPPEKRGGHYPVEVNLGER